MVRRLVDLLRAVNDREVPWRPAAPSFRTVLGLIVMLGGCGWVVFALQPFGRRGRAFAGIAAALACLVFEVPTRLGLPAARWTGRRFAPPRAVRTALIGVLACWLGLIAWSALSPGGPAPTRKNDPALIRVVTWNVLHGEEQGPPWRRCDWSVRKRALRAALLDARPDLLCVQEALAGQVAFIEAAMPAHRRVGAGRDDGRSAGEHCAIYFDADRFQEVGGGTFWLEEPADHPPARSALGPKRICTWVRLRDRRQGRHLRLYNTHLYLTERARLSATRLVLTRVDDGSSADALLVVGDFNATPDSPSRRRFARAGFVSSAELAGERRDPPTYHFYGVRLRNLDAILVGRGWRVVGHRILDVKPGNTFPSDHFGVMADLALGGGGQESGGDNVVN